MKMSIARKTEQSGFALLLVMFTIVAMILVMSSVMFWLSTNIKLTAKNIYFTSAQAAADAATEMAFAQMDKSFLLNSLQPASAYNTVLPDQTSWPVKFIFSDTNGITNQISIDEGTQAGNLQPLGLQYANLQGYAQIVTITATATPASQLFTSQSKQVSATVQQQINFATIPAFQFAIFYNINLEIDPGAAMNIAGSVFSNGGIWSGNGNPTYSSTVEAVGQVTTTSTDPFLTTYTDSGTPASNFLLTNPQQPRSGVSALEIPIGASTNNSETNVIAIIQIPPSSVAAPQQVAYASTNQSYTYNEATLIVSNWSGGSAIRSSTTANTPIGNNFAVYLQDSWSGPSWYGPSTGHFNVVTNDFYVVTNSVGSTVRTNVLVGLPGFALSNLPGSWGPTANMNINWTSGSGTNIIHWGVQYAGWSFLTNVSFYDYRESATVQAVQIDVSMLRTWITNNTLTGGSNWNHALCVDSGAGINSIYVYNAVPLSSTQLPAVRMVNGARLPNSTNAISSTNCITSGLTVVTPQPMYVLGNYNCQIDGDTSGSTAGSSDMSHTYPAALMADAITVLSPNWSGKDGSYTSSTSLATRTPTPEIFNAACLEGIVQSSTHYPTGGGANGYSGGVENFLRLLENWGSSTTLTYNGSIMVMFSSQYATNFWQLTGNYYNAPKRVWSFDTNFTQSVKLPPLTPQFTTVLRSNYNAY